jgi:transcriptional regulator with XRE-family HTH domain
MGKRLQALRKAVGMSQSDVARAVGVSVKTYQPWDQGKRSFTFETAVKLADAIGCTLEDLAGRKVPKTRKGGTP